MIAKLRLQGAAYASGKDVWAKTHVDSTAAWRIITMRTERDALAVAEFLRTFPNVREAAISEAAKFAGPHTAQG